MPFTIVRNDIINMEVDAIVNSAGSRTSRIGGVEGSILEAGGIELRKEQLNLGELEISEAKYTSAPNLLSNYVIHVRGPIYDGSDDNEVHLRDSYRNCLKLASNLKVNSIAIPVISSGSYGYPKKRAMLVAQEEILHFLENNELMIYLVVFDKKSFSVSKEFQMEVRQYVNTNYVARRRQSLRKKDSYKSLNRSTRLQNKIETEDSLEFIIEPVKEGFSKTLLSLIDKTGQTDAFIYKKANIDRKLFSKIRNNPHYRPSKNTILAFVIALELPLYLANDLLSRAGYILSESILFDVIITYCIKKNIYDIFEVNNMLFVYDQELLGSQ